MAEPSDKKRRQLIGLKTGTKIGILSGFGSVIVSWIVAGILKGVITNFTGVWPEWFPGHIVDAILSGWWVILIIVLFTAAGALIGVLFPRRYELL
ncbi:MAG: hypothetical protein PVJ75_17400 [Chloroflexota bacterium]|jgi:hypothetical protein